MRKQFEIGQNWQIVLSEDWTEWFQSHWNWQNFTLIKIAYEDEVYMGSRELDIAFLGFGVWVHWVYDYKTPARIEIQRRMDEWLDANHKE